SNEGENHSFSLGSFVDPGADSPWSVNVNWGDSTSDTFNTSPATSCPSATPCTLGSRSHTYADNGTYTVTETVTDKDNAASAATTFTVTVANANPVVTAAANQISGEGTSTSFSLGSFSDLGANDNPWLADVNWGDGTSH